MNGTKLFYEQLSVAIDWRRGKLYSNIYKNKNHLKSFFRSGAHESNVKIQWNMTEMQMVLGDFGWFFFLSIFIKTNAKTK